MAYIRGLLSALIFANLACCSAWEYAARAREEPPNYGAWYQMPQPGVYPPPAYERAAPTVPYGTYPRPYSRSPDYYPESAAVTNNMVPSPRKSPPGGYYPSIHGSQDKSRQTAVDRYLPLLNKRKSTPRPPSPDAASVMRTLQPKRPLVESWKCINKPCKKTTVFPVTVSPQKPNPLNPRPSLSKKKPQVVISVVKGVSRPKVTPRPQKSKTFATVPGIRLESVKPYTFRPRHRMSERTRTPATISSTVPSRVSSTVPSRTSTTTPSTPKKTEIIPKTTVRSKASTSVEPPAEFPYSLFWPNAELIAAIKDVVRKFKHSLERSGVHEDVRHMGSQLETTWNDLRRGKFDQWIDHAQQMFSDSVNNLQKSKNQLKENQKSNSQPIQQN